MGLYTYSPPEMDGALDASRTACYLDAEESSQFYHGMGVHTACMLSLSTQKLS